MIYLRQRRPSWPQFPLPRADPQAADAEEGVLPTPAAHPKLPAEVAALLKKRFLYLSRFIFYYFIRLCPESFIIRSNYFFLNFIIKFLGRVK